MEQTILPHLFEMQDLAYRDFQAKLIPTIDKARVIGVRTPQLRQYAKELAKAYKANPDGEVSAFLHTLPHHYYEENNLHGWLLALTVHDIGTLLAAIDLFLPYVDNWATCDMLAPKCFAKHPAEVLTAVHGWLKSDAVYTLRFGIVTLLQFYLDEQFQPKMLRDVAAVCHPDYYVQMAQAWYFSFALIKQYEAVLPLFTEGRLNCWVHNKSIQKATESYRISDERKAYLRTLKR